MTREEKVKKVEELVGVLSEAKGIYLVDFQGMTVGTISELRSRCRQENVRFEVVKNTLLRRAAEQTGNKVLVDYLEGPTALATSVEDEVSPARVLASFAKEFNAPRLKAGVIDGKPLDEKGIKAIASLPPRDVLLGNFLRALQGPLSNFVSVLTAPLRDLANVLDQVAKEKEKAS